MRKEISRRDFMKGTAAGALGIAAAGVLGACQKEAGEAGSTAATTAVGTTAEVETEPVIIADAVDPENFVMNAEYASKKWSFEIPPEPVDESQINETY